MSWRRRLTTVLASAVAASALAMLVPSGAQAAVPVLRFEGTGYGHGVGLSQWGAEHLARTGRTTSQILGTFYPGASLSETTGPVRVAVRPPGSATTTITLPQGGQIRSPLEGTQAKGFPIQVAPGGRARITFDGSYRVDGIVGAQGASATAYRAAPEQDECLYGLLCPTTTQPPTTTTTPPTSGPPTTGSPDPSQPGPSTSAPPASAASSQTVWAVPAKGGVTTVDERGRSYRGVIEATGGGALRLVNLLGVEDYLRGMAEVPGTWPAAAIQAQTIAARTYALRAMRAGGELCDDARCQVYVGRTAEKPGQDAAVAATRNLVITYKGALAAAVYSADAGGMSANAYEGFGTPDGVYPYLRNVRYETDNPLPWQLDVALDHLRARFSYPGTLTGVRLGEVGPSGRALSVVFEGSAGERTVDGRQFARSLGLRSTRYTVSVAMSDGSPPPPPEGGEAIQALPDEAAALATEPLSRPGLAELDTAIGSSDGIADALDLPAVADDRRRLLVAVLAAVLVAAATGAHAPLLLTRGRGLRRAGAAARARGWATWRIRRRSG